MCPFARSFQSWRIILRFIHCRFNVGLVSGFHVIVDYVNALEYKELHAVLTELQLPLFITINRSFSRDHSITHSFIHSFIQSPKTHSLSHSLFHSSNHLQNNPFSPFNPISTTLPRTKKPPMRQFTH